MIFAVSVVLFALCLTLIDSIFQIRDLNAQLAEKQKDMQRTCVMKQGQALIEMQCTVIDRKFATTF